MTGPLVTLPVWPQIGQSVIGGFSHIDRPLLKTCRRKRRAIESSALTRRPAPMKNSTSSMTKYVAASSVPLLSTTKLPASVSQS